MSVDKVQARKMVLVSAFLLAVIAVYRDRTKSGAAADTFHALWGVGVLSWLLSLLADFMPTIAGPFAVLTVLGSMTSGGSSIIDKMLGTVAAKPATTAPAKPVASTQTTTTGGTK